MKKLQSKGWMIVLVIMLLAIGGGAWWFIKVKNAPAKRTFKEYKIEKGDLEVSIQATGQVQPENRLVVKPSIAGRIEQVLFDEGRAVKAGQILA